MKMPNEIWMIQFVFKKKRVLVCILLAVMYVIVIPYQGNLIRYFGNAEAAKGLFWKSTFLYHGVFALTVIFQAAIQLMDTEAPELCIMWKKQIISVLAGVFALYQIFMFPVYIWYASVYPEELLNLFLLLLVQIISVSIFYIIAFLSYKTILGFLAVFIALLLVFN